MIVNSGLRDVMDGGELLYFGEEYAEFGYYDQDPEEELERMRKKEERRLSLQRKKAEKS